MTEVPGTPATAEEIEQVATQGGVVHGRDGTTTAPELVAPWPPGTPCLPGQPCHAGDP